MIAKDGIMVISVEEARVMLCALDDRPLDNGDLEALRRVKQRMWDNVIAREKTRILREIDANNEWWEVKCLCLRRN